MKAEQVLQARLPVLGRIPPVDVVQAGCKGPDATLSVLSSEGANSR
ncbi:MAG: hypothetical protein JSV66_16610 [Trueperaceae bacterium]|nr:MAG: hypothetical protein JSV66_16610 [Trueperaceae bacterium]